MAGAFLAGATALGKLGIRHALESRIEPFKGLLLGLFFIGVGMSIIICTCLKPIAHFVILLLISIIKIVAPWRAPDVGAE